MFDSFEIITASGLVLWSRVNTEVSPQIVNGFIKDIFIEENAGKSATIRSSGAAQYKREKFTLKWTTAKDLGLIFVAVYHSILQLSWVDELLENVKTLFVQLFADRIREEPRTDGNYEFDRYFDQQLGALSGAADVNGLLKAGPTSDPLPVKADPIIGDAASNLDIPKPDGELLSPTDSLLPSRPITPADGKGLSRRAKKAAAASSQANASGTDDDSRAKKTTKTTTKKLRKWDVDGNVDDSEDVELDYSAPLKERKNRQLDEDEMVSADAAGSRTNQGQFILKDLDTEVSERLRMATSDTPKEASNGMLRTGLGTLTGLFRNVVGGKVLTKADLEKPLKGMEEHLLKKNVAREAVVRLLEGVEQDLVGTKTGAFETFEAALRASMRKSLAKILTPTTSLDLLRSIENVTKPADKTKYRPYVISIVGVNGVGKSTNLSKIAYFLVQNDKKILIAACDTFRSGAVEQLRTHAERLSELSAREGLGSIELYERGYGKDAANIAKDAIDYATAKGLDLVLIDTAGRRHNDQRLMSSLEKFATLAKPDKIFMVGEALVGSDSVSQARNFNAAFGRDRRLDGFIISKCDTVGDMVGSLVSMVHATNIPVAFLGVGQTYSDLRTLNVDWAVGLLMQ